jgi:hypothetical protein
MSHSIEFACPHSDDVLARHLDGHVAADGAAATSGAAMSDSPRSEAARDAAPEMLAARLDAHLVECGRCQQALRRARRLDAMLAHEAGQFVATQSGADGELAATERWFAAVAAAAVTASPPPIVPTSEAPAPDRAMPDRTTPDGTMLQPLRARAARSPLRTWLTSLAAAAGTLAVVAWWIAGKATNRDVVTTPRGDSPAVDSPAVASPAAGASTVSPPAPDAPLPGNAPFASASQGDSLSQGDSAPAPVAVELDLRRLPKWVQPRTDAAAQPPRARPDAARQPASQQVTRGPNTTRPGGTSRPDLLALRRQLDDGDVSEAQLAFCARLANGELDEALRRHVRRCPQRLEAVVTALQQGPLRHGTAQLLLDLWDDGVCRNRLQDDEHAAARLFTGQPAGTFQQLQHELATSVQAARRSRCLLALGCARDVDVGDTLLAQLDAPRHEDALLAAFALSCLPGPMLARVAQREPTSFLLRAAVLRSEADELADVRAQGGESAELRQRLRGASLPVFCELASWRRHGADASE